MIRIGLPPPVLPRLRLRWHVTQTLFARHSRSLREYMDSRLETSRAWWREIVLGFHTHWHPGVRLGRRSLTAARAPETRAEALRAEPTVLTAVEAACDTQELLSAFETRYEDLVDLLCWAAKDGVHTNRDARYAELRAWMLANYGALRPRLQAIWNPLGDPALADPFEPLFASENVDDFLNSEDSVQFMMDARCALECLKDEG